MLVFAWPSYSYLTLWELSLNSPAGKTTGAAYGCVTFSSNHDLNTHIMYFEAAAFNKPYMQAVAGILVGALQPDNCSVTIVADEYFDFVPPNLQLYSNMPK